METSKTEQLLKWVHDLCCDSESIWAVIELLASESNSRENAILTLVAMNLESVQKQINQFSDTL